MKIKRVQVGEEQYGNLRGLRLLDGTALEQNPEFGQIYIGVGGEDHGFRLKCLGVRDGSDPTRPRFFLDRKLDTPVFGDERKLSRNEDLYPQVRTVSKEQQNVLDQIRQRAIDQTDPEAELKEIREEVPKKKRNISPEGLVKKQQAGRYMALLRKLSPEQKQKVLKMRIEKGIDETMKYLEGVANV